MAWSAVISRKAKRAMSFALARSSKMCSSEYTVVVGYPIYFDLKRQAFVPAGTRGAKIIATAALTCHRCDNRLVVQINGNDCTRYPMQST